MNESANQTDALSASEDQLAVAEYRSSAAYARARSRVGGPIRRRRRRGWPDRALSPTTSLAMAPIGFGGMLFLCGFVAPGMLGGLYASLDVGNAYIAFTLIEATILLPTIITFAFVAVTPMFWHGGVLLRFALATGSALLGCTVFLAQTSLLHPMVLLATFLDIAAVAVLAQMWGRWTLSHSRQIESPLSPISTRSIMELTVAAAIGCVLLLSADLTDHVDALLLALAVGSCAAVAVLAVLIAFLRPRGPNLFAAVVAALFALAVAVMLCGMRALAEFGWGSLAKMLPSVLGAAVYGLVVCAVTMWICIAWLRVCGWICLNRDEEKQARESDAEHWTQRLFSRPEHGGEQGLTR